MDISLLGFSGVREMFNIHPAFVHFPIALLPSALLFYVLGLTLGKKTLLVAGRGSLYMALAGTIVALWTGFRAEGSFPHNDTIHNMMETHEAIGIALLILTAFLALWTFWQSDQRPKGAWVFVAGLALASYLGFQNSDLGARMVYVEGAAVKPAVPVVTGTGNKEKPTSGEELEGHHGDNGGPEHDHGGHAH
ncbi:MAG: DUF2231 domain-containing protein [Elusimicrobia bacterium]|jgi:uncharacterized membrane protein|nr:DUF2231 domain-containing protein [Elusimicrobiota bacterium]